ncbi:GNAT family N-acetyltransferase [Pelagibacterium sp. H642]|uniref:GNAT family N-acetyltransferase n=1 Tax=Pelagibacterium sp. H642 TaxID=1881069 RepID=UPI002815B39B|nr:GNAT family N-acetyltransferase [Pelagibacterium sp. H642]WMT90165.1 GNAT family N-acetyltransferase [Pelagibacterium sp. H642]
MASSDVRFAIPEDRYRVISMCRDAHAAGKLPWQFSAPHADALFRQSLQMPDRACIVFAPERTAQGFLLAYVSPSPMANIAFARDFGWWIDPGHRGRAAGEMLEAFELWAEQRNATFAGMAAMEANPRAGRIYERRGYVKTETHYYKRLT